MLKKILLAMLLVGPLSFFAAQTVDAKSLDLSLQQSAKNYLEKYQAAEYITGVALSVSLPDRAKVHQYFAGNVSREPHSIKLHEANLYQIGSITKSFTTAIILQLEAEGKLSIEQTIGDFLPQYPAWKSVTIKQLLNMTSGIPDYFYTTEGLAIEGNNIRHQWKPEEINALVYPNLNEKFGFDYSNTNCWIAGMIIEKVTGHSFENELKTRILKPLKLNNTFYSIKPYSGTIMARMIQGYYYDNRYMSKLYGKNATDFNMSYAGPAGAIVADLVDVTRWVQALYSTKLFPAQQLKELTSLVSMETGKPISEVDQQDPKGFGLGVGRLHHPVYGNLWYYEGETLGYRTLYMYKTCNQVIVSVALNSAVNPETGQDHIGTLFEEAYGKILEAHPNLRCDMTK